MRRLFLHLLLNKLRLDFLNSSEVFTMEKLQKVARRAVSVRFVRFFTLGGSVTLLGVGILFLLVRVFKIPLEIANLLQLIIFVEVNFLVNNRWVWNDRNESSFFDRFFKFHICRFLISIPLGQVLYIFMIQNLLLRENYIIPYLVNICVIMAVNYWLNDLFVFRVNSKKVALQ